MSGEPRVLHVNDCADVGLRLVRAARNRGLPWDLLPPDRLRPPGGFGGGLPARAGSAAYVLRLAKAVHAHDVLHVHYANTVGLVDKPWIPRRPYALTLHGTDIREQWHDPATHADVQRAVDGAFRVYYTNVDTAESACAARADATYRPQFVDLATLPTWCPATDLPPYVAFASRWDASKAAPAQVDFARRLAAALPAGVQLEGLDWGEGAPTAAGVGVRLRPRMTHGDYVRWLAGATVVIGQPTGILAVSELEAIAMGAPVVVPHRLLPVPAGEHVAAHGDAEEMLDVAVAVVADPAAVASVPAGPAWVGGYFVAERWVDAFREDYRAAHRQAP